MTGFEEHLFRSVGLESSKILRSINNFLALIWLVILVDVSINEGPCER